MGLLRQPIWGYAPGGCYDYPFLLMKPGSGFTLPSDIGVRVGNSGIKYMVLEFHFDNPQLLSNFFDNSGVRIYSTTQLRPRVAGVITTSPMYINYK